MRNTLLMLAILAGAVALAILVGGRQPQAATTWEYKVLRESHEPWERTLNDHGAQGWELVTATVATEPRQEDKLTYVHIYKRRK